MCHHEMKNDMSVPVLSHTSFEGNSAKTCLAYLHLDDLRYVTDGLNAFLK